MPTILPHHRTALFFRRIRDVSSSIFFLFCLLLLLATLLGTRISAFSPPYSIRQSTATSTTTLWWGTTTSPTATFAVTSGSSSTTTTPSSASIATSNEIPFVVERIQGIPSSKSKIYKEIACMCIEAFFNDDQNACTASSSTSSSLPMPTPPWKALQLAYLRGLQQGDLRRRRERDSASNMMFVARSIEAVEEYGNVSPSYLSSPLILDMSNVYNFHHQPQQQQEGTSSSSSRSRTRGGEDDRHVDYVRGGILGFVEVTNRPFPLVGVSTGSSSDGGVVTTTKRPVLTNLSVCNYARGAGVGSKLLEICEQHVESEWGQSEMILEVEEDNELAKNFYQKRGYEVVYTDKTARKYDLSGLWLREVRCNRLVMRKELQKADAVQTSVSFGIKVLQALRDNMFAGVA